MNAVGSRPRWTSSSFYRLFLSFQVSTCDSGQPLGGFRFHQPVVWGDQLPSRRKREQDQHHGKTCDQPPMRLVRVVCCALPAVSPSIISGRKSMRCRQIVRDRPVIDGCPDRGEGRQTSSSYYYYYYYCTLEPPSIVRPNSHRREGVKRQRRRHTPLPPCTAFAYTQSSDCSSSSPLFSTFSWAASCDEVKEEGHFGVAERRFILSGYRGTKSQKVAADAGVQASRKTVCTATGTCVCAAAQSAFVYSIGHPKHRPRFIQMHSCLGYRMQRQARGTLTISVKRTHTMGRRMSNGPADERRERTRACACLSSSICRRIAQQDTGSKAESRFHRLRRFCTIEARFSLSLSAGARSSSQRRRFIITTVRSNGCTALPWGHRRTVPWLARGWQPADRVCVPPKMTLPMREITSMRCDGACSLLHRPNQGTWT